MAISTRTTATKEVEIPKPLQNTFRSFCLLDSFRSASNSFPSSPFCASNTELVLRKDLFSSTQSFSDTCNPEITLSALCKDTDRLLSSSFASNPSASALLISDNGGNFVACDKLVNQNKLTRIRLSINLIINGNEFVYYRLNTF